MLILRLASAEVQKTKAAVAKAEAELRFAKRKKEWRSCTPRRDWLRAERRWSRQTRMWRTIVQLYKALGGGWQPDQPTAGAAADTAAVVKTASQR